MQSAEPVEKTALPLGHGEAQPLLEMEGIVKTFPGVRALGGVDFTVLHGEVHVLFGENGAGKSTLINIIAGTYPADDGRMQFDGRPIKGLTPHGARLIGISPVFQEFSLAPDLTVNAVAPGPIATDMLSKERADEIVKLVPMRRLGTAEEVAHLVAFLASDEAAYITGQVIGINGGLL